MVRDIDSKKADVRWLQKTLEELNPTVEQTEADKQLHNLSEALQRYEMLMPAIEITTTKSSTVLKVRPPHHTLILNMYHGNRGRYSAHHTVPPNIYHDNRGRHSAHHTLLPYMYHDNRGRLSAHHTLLLNMYHDNRGSVAAHHILLPNLYHDNRNIC